MKRIFSSSRKHFNTLIAVFLLAFASVFTFFFAYEGWSFAADGTVPQKFEIKWTSPVDDGYLNYDSEGMAWLTQKMNKNVCSTNFSGRRIKMNVGFIAGGTGAYPSETLTLKIPKYIVKKRDGGYQGTWDIGLSKQKSGSTGFYYNDTSDPYYFIIKNFEEISTTREISFDITYTIGNCEEMYNLVDESTHETMGVVEIQGESKGSNRLKVHLDTWTSLSNFSKTSTDNAPYRDGPTVYYEWPNDPEKKPEDADDFIYIVWEILIGIPVDTTQLSNIIITDSPENNGEVVEWYMSSYTTSDNGCPSGIGSNRFGLYCVIDGNKLSANNITSLRCSTGWGECEINVLTRYPKSELNQNADTVLYNNAEIVFDGIDNTHDEETVRAKVVVKPDVFNPTSTRTVKYSKYCNKSKGIRGSLDKIVAEKDVWVSCYMDVEQYAYPLTLRQGGDPQNPGDYGQRHYKMELTDDLLVMDDEPLQNSDYDINYFRGYMSFYNYNHTSSGWKEEYEFATIDADIYIKNDDGWHKYGTLTFYNGSQSFVNMNGESVQQVQPQGCEEYMGCSHYFPLPAGTKGVKSVVSSNRYKTNLNLGFLFSIENSDHIRDIIDDKQEVDLQNVSTYRLFDADNSWRNRTSQYGKPTTLSDIIKERDFNEYGESDVLAKHANDSEKLSRIYVVPSVSKDVSQKTNQPDKSRLKLSYNVTVNSNDSDLDISNETGVYDDWDYGTFYDLLPLGMKIDLDSIECVEKTGYKSDPPIDIMICEKKELIPNWRGSGRDMLIVKSEHSSGYDDYPIKGYWNLKYDAYYSYESMMDYGVRLVNSVGFQNAGKIVESLDPHEAFRQLSVAPNDGTYCNGGPYIGKVGGEYSGGAFIYGCTDQDLMSNLGDNPEQDTLYAEVTTTIDDPINAELSSTKKVMAAKDVNYTMETETEQDALYKYRLRTATAEGSSASNIIVYDVLEDAEPENKNRWEGFFDSVDVTQPILKGADPVIYYSTKKDIKLCEQTSICPDNDLDNGLVWTNRLDDIADKKDVTAIAVDMRKKTDGTNFSIGEKEAVSVIVNMRAPKGGIVKQYMDSDAVALNESWFSNTLSQNDGSNVSGMTKSQITRVHIKAPDLDINKTSNPETGTQDNRTDLINNTTLDYTINLKNNDDTTYTNVEIEDTIPEGLTIVPEQIQLTSGELIPQEDSEEAESANVVYRIDPNNPNRIIFTIKTLNPLATISIVVPTTLPKYVDRDMTYDNTPQINSIDSEEYIVRGNTTYHEKKAPTMSTNISALIQIPCPESCPPPLPREAEEDGLVIQADEFDGAEVFDRNYLDNLPVGDYRIETKLMQIEKDYSTIPETQAATASTNFQVISQDGENQLQRNGFIWDEIMTTLSDFTLAPRSVYVAYAYLYDTTTTPETLVTKLEDKTDKLETIITGNTSHDLTISKAITGDGADANEEFNFSVELKGLTKNKTYTTSLPNVNVVADASGNATLYNVKLKGGESLTINDLDTLATYKVQEAASTYFSSYDQTGSQSNTNFSQKAYTNEKRYLPLTTNEEQILDETGDISIAFTNHKLAYAMSTLASIALEDADSGETETKTATEHGLSISSDEGKDANVKDQVTIDNLIEGDYQLVTSLYNKTTEELADNILTTNFSVNTDDELVQDGEVVDKLTINLPTTTLLPRTTYVIYEAIYQEGNLILAHHNSEDKLQTIIVDNSHYNLTLSKELTGTGTSTEDSFNFTLSFTNLSPETRYETNITETTFTTDEEGKANLEVALKGGEEITIKDLDTLSHYIVEETESDYIASYKQTATLDTATFTKAENAQEKSNLALATEEEQILDENGNITVAFTNHKDKDPDPIPEKKEILPTNPRTRDHKVSTMLIMLGSSVVLLGASTLMRSRRVLK